MALTLRSILALIGAVLIGSHSASADGLSLGVDVPVAMDDGEFREYVEFIGVPAEQAEPILAAYRVAQQQLVDRNDRIREVAAAAVSSVDEEYFERLTEDLRTVQAASSRADAAVFVQLGGLLNENETEALLRLEVARLRRAYRAHEVNRKLMTLPMPRIDLLRTFDCLDAGLRSDRDVLDVELQALTRTVILLEALRQKRIQAGWREHELRGGQKIAHGVDRETLEAYRRPWAGYENSEASLASANRATVRDLSPYVTADQYEIMLEDMQAQAYPMAYPDARRVRLDAATYDALSGEEQQLIETLLSDYRDRYKFICADLDRALSDQAKMMRPLRMFRADDYQVSKSRINALMMLRDELNRRTAELVAAVVDDVKSGERGAASSTGRIDFR